MRGPPQIRGIWPNSHVYIAACGDAVKIGATYNVENRGVALRRHHGRRFEIVQAWPHADPYAIEAMVLNSLSWMGFERPSKEVFIVSPLTVKREIGRAMRCYEVKNMDHHWTAKEVREAWRWTRYRWHHTVIRRSHERAGRCG